MTPTERKRTIAILDTAISTGSSVYLSIHASLEQVSAFARVFPLYYGGETETSYVLYPDKNNKAVVVHERKEEVPDRGYDVT